MHVRDTIRSALLALATVLVLGLAVGRAAGTGKFGLSANLDVSRIELRLELFMVCVRVEAELHGRFAASAHFLSCTEGACQQPRLRLS